MTSRGWLSGSVIIGLLFILGLGLFVPGIGATGDDPSVNASVDPALETADGPVDALVFFEPGDGVGLAGDDDPVRMAQATAASSQAPLETLAAETDGLSVTRSFWIANAVLVSIDTEQVSLDRLAALAGVEALTTNPTVKAPSTVDAEPISTDRGGDIAGTATTAGDERAESTTGETASDDTTYGLEMIDAPTVWEAYDTRGEGARVAVLDTGVDPDHPDIELTGWTEFDSDGNEIDTDPQDYDPGGHGTHVSGTVVGGNASGEYIGVAPNASLYHVPVLPDCDPDCTGTAAQVFSGMEWAVEQDADVMSMSLGGGGYNPFYINPVRTAEAAGTTVVASAGNDGVNTSGSPANVFESIAAGAADSDQDIATFSSGERINRSDWAWFAPDEWPAEYVVPTVAAPGVSVKSAIPGGDYTTKSGTSMAAPHVSGAIALLQSGTDEEIGPADFEVALESSAWNPTSDDPAERDIRYGSGIIDVPAALELLTEGPRVRFTADPGEPVVTDPVTFNASATTGTDGDPFRWDLTGDGSFETETDDLTVTRQYNTSGVTRVTLRVSDGANQTHWRTMPLSVQLPPPIFGTNSPLDLDGDGLYEDVLGNRELGIFDVQALFHVVAGTVSTEYPHLFNFAGDRPNRVTITDVQALFERLRAS